MVFCSVRLHWGALHLLPAEVRSHEHSVDCFELLTLTQSCYLSKIVDDVSDSRRVACVLTCFLKLHFFAPPYECVCTVMGPIKACDQVQVCAGCRRQAGRRSALCPHLGGWMVCLGTAVCSLSKTVGTAFIPIHHLRRDDLAFRGAGRLSALLMRF